MHLKLASVIALSALALAGLPAGVANARTTTTQLLLPNDFRGVGKSQQVVWNPTTGVWSVNGLGSVGFGTQDDIPTPVNYGDGVAVIGVFRPSNGTWYLGNKAGSTHATVKFGASGDIPVAAHYDGYTNGDGSVLALFRPSNGTWYPYGGRSVQFGQDGDIPVPGHYAGTSANYYADRFAVFRPSTGTWYFDGSPSIQFGQSGDIPAPADYNGDGVTDVAVYRPSTNTFYVRGQGSVAWGARGDIPVTDDFNGDGKADFAVYRPSNHTWYVKGGKTVTFGGSGLVPIGAAPYRD